MKNKCVDSIHSDQVNIMAQEKVIEWGHARGIFEHSTVTKQYLKSLSELGEVCDALAKDDIEHAKMEIGDFIVALILLGEMRGERFKVQEETYGGKTHELITIICSDIVGSSWWLARLCFELGTTQGECLQMAYDKISKRKTTIVNGVAVKEEL